MFYEYFEKFSVKKNMSRNVPTLNSDSTLADSLSILLNYKTDIAAVTDDNRNVVGIITKNIVIRALLDLKTTEANISPYVRKDFVYALESYSIFDVKENILKRKLTNAVVLDNDHKYVGLINKITLLKSLEVLNRFYSSELLALLNTATNGIIKINAMGKIVLANQAALEILGVNKDDVMDKPSNLFIPYFDYEAWTNLTVNSKKIVAKKTKIHTDTNIPNSETLIIFYDLTEFNEISQQLNISLELKETLNTILNSSDNGLMVTNEQNIVTFCNDSICKLFEIPKEGILNKPISDFLNVPSINTRINNIETVAINSVNCLFMSYPMSNNNGYVVKLIFNDLPKLKNSLFKIENLEKQLDYYKSALSKATDSNFGTDRIITRNKYMNYLKSQIKLTSNKNTTILLLGDSGTGKEVFAKAIHEESQRKGNFVKVNCAAIPENLLESEFFGYVDGAFTGSKKGGKIGKFQMANNGTLFLDEIGDMGSMLQAKLLRVLQEQEFEQVGGTQTIKVDVRIIAATNKDLKKLIYEGKFREDLYYRLNVIPINIPSLCSRKEDILPLCDHLIDKFNKKLGTAVSSISPEAVNLLEMYDWPGNVRELENILERILNFNTIAEILPEHILPHINFPNKYSNSAEYDEIYSPADEMSDVNQDLINDNEKKLILAALKKANNNKSKAAQLLNMSRTTLYLKLAKYNIG